MQRLKANCWAVLGLCAGLLLAACQAPGTGGYAPYFSQNLPALSSLGESPAQPVSSLPTPPAEARRQGDVARQSSPLPQVSPVPLPTVPTPRPTLPPPPLDLRTSDNLLLLGTDRRPNEGIWHTDSIIIVGLDRQHNRAALLSVPRDLYVQIPGYGPGRINLADYVGEKILQVEGGGPALLSQVIRETLNVPTHHWIRIEMQGFRDVVDALGGVRVQLDCPFYELIYDLDVQDWTYFTLPAGDVQMDGETAYFFVRLRYLSSDISRAQRQRQFLWALRQQAQSTNLLPRVPELWTAFQQTFSTDLSLFQMLDLMRFGLALEQENVRASGITQKELERLVTEQGADVLRIGEQAKVNAVIDSIWSSESLAATGTRASGGCPPPPSGVPEYVTRLFVPIPVPTSPGE